MDDKKTSKTREKPKKEAINEQYHRVLENTDELLEEGKKRVAEVQDVLKEYGDELAKNVQKNPLTSVLIAGGIGFILSSLLKK